MVMMLLIFMCCLFWLNELFYGVMVVLLLLNVFGVKLM